MSAFVLAALAVMVGALAPAPVRAQTAAAEPSAKRERDAVHLTDALRANDPKLAETFDGAADSLRAGHELVILFDGRSVTALRMSQKQKKTPLEELGLRPEEQATWAERLGLPASQAPHSHLELVQRLAGAGAKVFVNRNAVKLYGLTDEEIHPIARPISARQMGKLLDETGLCYTYGQH